MVRYILNKKEHKPDFKIGIVLSGGGAKGAYQAGAMKAIWEFLKEVGDEKLDCRQNVKFIAGTSIGSWNALYWLLNEMDRIDDFWTDLQIGNLFGPEFYVPFLGNPALVDVNPWKSYYEKINIYDLFQLG